MEAEEPLGYGAAIAQVGTCSWSLCFLTSGTKHTQAWGGPTLNSRSQWITWLASLVLLQAYEREICIIWLFVAEIGWARARRELGDFRNREGT